MSRVGKLPIPIPGGVTITVDDSEITVAGSKGTLKQFTMPGITVKQEGDELVVSRANDEPKIRAKHGSTSRAKISVTMLTYVKYAALRYSIFISSCTTL